MVFYTWQRVLCIVRISKSVKVSDKWTHERQGTYLLLVALFIVCAVCYRYLCVVGFSYNGDLTCNTDLSTERHGVSIVN